MATWQFTVSARSGVGEGGFASNDITEPGDFDGATIDSVAVVGTPTIDSDGTTDDFIGIRFAVEEADGTDVYGTLSSGTACMCVGDQVGEFDAAADIVLGSAISPAPTIAVAVDWNKVTYNASYTANMMGDAETVSWSAFDILVTYTPATGVTVGITTVFTTPAVGTVDNECEVDLSGEVATSAAGDIDNETRIDLIGEASVPAVGSLTEDHPSTVALTGEAAAPGIGSLTEDHPSTVILTGEVSTPAVGDIDKTFDIDLSGEVATPAVGNVDKTLGIDLTGLFTTPQVGNVDNETRVDITSAGAFSSAFSSAFDVASVVVPNVGSVGAETRIDLIGEQTASAVGTVTAVLPEGGVFPYPSIKRRRAMHVLLTM